MPIATREEAHLPFSFISLLYAFAHVVRICVCEVVGVEKRSGSLICRGSKGVCKRFIARTPRQAPISFGGGGRSVMDDFEVTRYAGCRYSPRCRRALCVYFIWGRKGGCGNGTDGD